VLFELEPVPFVEVGTVIVFPGATGDKRYSSPAIFALGHVQVDVNNKIKCNTIRIRISLISFFIKTKSIHKTAYQYFTIILPSPGNTYTEQIPAKVDTIV
jgi:hypothetical protein